MQEKITMKHLGGTCWCCSKAMDIAWYSDHSIARLALLLPGVMGEETDIDYSRPFKTSCGSAGTGSRQKSSVLGSPKASWDCVLATGSPQDYFLILSSFYNLLCVLGDLWGGISWSSSDLHSLELAAKKTYWEKEKQIRVHQGLVVWTGKSWKVLETFLLSPQGMGEPCLH